MKREFLTNLGIEADAVNQIMAEHGKTVNSINSSYKEEVDTLKQEVAEKDTQIIELETKANEAEKFQAELEQSREQTEAAQVELKDAKVERALIEAGVNDLDYAKFKLGSVEDLDTLNEQIETLKGQIPNQFESSKQEEPSGYKRINNGPLEPPKDKTKLTKEGILSIENKEERLKAIAENRNLFM